MSSRVQHTQTSKCKHYHQQLFRENRQILTKHKPIHKKYEQKLNLNNKIKSTKTIQIEFSVQNGKII